MMKNLENSTIYINDEEVSKYLKKGKQTLFYKIENTLKSYSAGKIVQPVRAAVPVSNHNGVLFAMPAYDAEENEMATKIVTVFPQNKKIGLSAIQAVILLFEANTGKLKAILDGDAVTKARTAAASLVATKYLANKKEVLAILGSGAQAQSHYEAFCKFFDIKKIFIWNVNHESAVNLAEKIKQEGFHCEVSDTVENAVKDADIIVTATMATEPILKKAWVKEGAHINAIGAPVPEWQELENDLLQSAIIYVDSREAALVESGDIIKSKAPIYAEIGEVILGLKEALPQKTTVFKSLGMAAEDVTTAELVYKSYKEHEGQQ